MKGFIEVMQTSEVKTLVAVKEIKAIEQYEHFTVIILNFTTTKKSEFRGFLFIKETYEEVVAKVEEATR